MPKNYPFHFLKSDFNQFMQRRHFIVEAIEKTSKNSTQTEENLINLTISLYKSIADNCMSSGRKLVLLFKLKMII